MCYKKIIIHIAKKHKMCYKLTTLSYGQKPSLISFSSILAFTHFVDILSATLN